MYAVEVEAVTTSTTNNGQALPSEIGQKKQMTKAVAVSEKTLRRLRRDTLL
jgi:hypothetical protein